MCASQTNGHSHSSTGRNEQLKLSIAALGIVFGDIGTSPLYAIKECFAPVHGVLPTTENVFGILSLVFWALTLVVAVKYVVFILRADNHGEGGIMALLALLISKLKEQGREVQKIAIILLGIFGAALLYGDGVITPAISVLSAIEGLQVATPAFQPLIVPLTVGILIGLFAVQRRGTARIGAIFGPTTLIWFITIAAIGIPWILKHPSVLAAVHPKYAFEFFLHNGTHGFFILSAVVLCITGAEALYADMGHFGKGPIRFSWFSIVFPALLLNYFGQGALILEKGGEVISNPFYGLVSGWMLYPLVALATAATVIASQALISGAYSLTQQAVQLGYLPRMTILHTSRKTEGQIYAPKVNLFLMIACIAIVIQFKESSNLAAAYGIAVTGTMLISSLLFFWVTRFIWGWSLIVSSVMLGAFMIVDVAFFTANATKVIHGGWITLLIAGSLYALMTTWKRGRKELAKSLMSVATPLSQFLTDIGTKPPPRVKGTAVFMTLTQDIAPSVLLHHFRHNQVLHERIILLSIVTKNEPEISALERVRVTEMEHGFVKIIARFGYMETPDLSEIFALCQGAGFVVDQESLSFYLGRETFLTNGGSGMARWRKRIFVFLSRNARPATEYFNIPPDRVIEIGSQIRI